MVAMKLLPAVWFLTIYRMQEQDGTKKKKTPLPSSPLSSPESDNLQQPDCRGSCRQMKR